jgi:hypothetical protein
MDIIKQKRLALQWGGGHRGMGIGLMAAEPEPAVRGTNFLKLLVLLFLGFALGFGACCLLDAAYFDRCCWKSTGRLVVKLVVNANVS